MKNLRSNSPIWIARTVLRIEKSYKQWTLWSRNPADLNKYNNIWKHGRHDNVTVYSSCFRLQWTYYRFAGRTIRSDQLFRWKFITCNRWYAYSLYILAGLGTTFRGRGHKTFKNRAHDMSYILYEIELVKRWRSAAEQVSLMKILHVENNMVLISYSLCPLNGRNGTLMLTVNYFYNNLVHRRGSRSWPD